MNFYVQFELLKEILRIFNLGCGCQKSAVDISFHSNFSTAAPRHFMETEWRGEMRSDFLQEPFLAEGTIQECYEQMAKKIHELSRGFIELMVANRDEWYTGQETKNKINQLFRALIETEETVK